MSIKIITGSEPSRGLTSFLILTVKMTLQTTHEMYVTVGAEVDDAFLILTVCKCYCFSKVDMLESCLGMIIIINKKRNNSLYMLYSSF